MNPPASLVQIFVDGRPVDVPASASVAAAIARLSLSLGRGPSGRTRAPLCGMGVCFECRVRIDGAAHQRACMTIVYGGMRVETAEEPAHG